MVKREDIASWLQGPPVAGEKDLPDGTTEPAGVRLGFPATGQGSIGRMSRRIPALLIDWLACQAIAMAFFDYRVGGGGGSGSFAPLMVFFVENVLLVGTLGSTLGHRLCGLRVVTVDGRYAGVRRALWRTVLLCLVVPAAIWDRDNRGMHDRLAGTVLVRN
ncbi:hypothetical protein KEM60_02630 [Austwickia sp. TVS 96-490-7B]|uniref:RDD family protein n=1 Tax=Austwickia sp. TVS 96-490-7B TaxID=2830843 RepID=UPI001C567316|nr:RDD family protein [Austwickia sp. TVS 96-490-7B]MBW3086412.1 hypothetical protein [Austwickia sp. TVS 96-490-7B]